MMTRSIKFVIKGLIIVSIIFYSAPSKAQIKYETKNYTHNLSPLKISFSFLNMEQFLTPMTAGLLVEGQLKDKLFYNMQFRQGYLKNLNSRNTITTQKQGKGSVFEAGVDLPFSDIIKSGKVKVSTSTSFDGTYLSEKYFKANCEVRRYWALSGGIMSYNRPKYVNSDSAVFIISDNQDIRPPAEKFTHFNQSTLGFYGGLVRRKIKKAVVGSNNWNYRTFYSTKFYAQVLIGSTTVDDIIYNTQTYKIDNVKQAPIGYRLGWQWDQMGVVTGFEFGKMPGVSLETNVERDELSKIFSDNPYLNYARFNIFNGDKRYAMK